MQHNSKSISIQKIPKTSSFIRQYATLVKKEFKIQIRYPISFVSSFVMIFLIIAVFTMVSKLFISNGETNSSSFSSTNLATYMFWGFLAFNFFGTTLYSLGTSLRNEQQTGTLETLFLLPMNQLANLLAKISWGIFINVFVGIFGFFVIELLTGNVLLPYPGIIITLIAFFCFFLQINGLAFLIAGLSIRLKESIEPIVNFGQFVLMIFCSFFLPFSVLGPLVIISYFFPMSYSIDILRTGIFNSTPELASNLINLGYGQIMVQLEWLVMLATAIFFPLFGYKYYLHSIYVGRKKGDLSDY